MKSLVTAVSRNWRCTLLSIFIVAVLFRGAFILTLQDGFYFPDSVAYSNAAINLLSNGELGESYKRPPGYPVFLAGIYLFFGENIFAVRMVESLIGALVAVLIALIAQRMIGQTTGVIAGFLWSIYPLGVFIVGLVYPTNLLTMLLACGLLCFLPRSQEPFSPQKTFLAGVVWGLATLTIPIVLLTIGVTSLWLIWHSRAKGLALVSLLFLGSALTIVPWTVRDFYVHHQIVLVEPRVVQQLPRIQVANHDIPQGKVQVILKYPDLFANHFFSEFLRFWKLYPDRIAMDTPGFREKRHEKDARVVKNTIFSTGNLINTISILSTGPIFFFAIIGTFASCFQRERRRDLLLLWGAILSFAVGYSAFYAKTRYRIPIEPYIIVLSAYGMKKTWDLLAARFARGNQVQAEVKAEAIVGDVRGSKFEV